MLARLTIPIMGKKSSTMLFTISLLFLKTGGSTRKWSWRSSWKWSCCLGIINKKIAKLSLSLLITKYWENFGIKFYLPYWNLTGAKYDKYFAINQVSNQSKLVKLHQKQVSYIQTLQKKKKKLRPQNIPNCQMLKCASLFLYQKCREPWKWKRKS